jgi:hypothetical protein
MDVVVMGYQSFLTKMFICMMEVDFIHLSLGIALAKILADVK